MATITVTESYSPTESLRLMPITVVVGYLYTKTSILKWKKPPEIPVRMLSPTALPSIARLKKPERAALAPGVVSPILRLMPISSSESLPATEVVSIYPKSASDDITTVFSESTSITVT